MITVSEVFKISPGLVLYPVQSKINGLTVHHMMDGPYIEIDQSGSVMLST